jgi:hypothetical protein
LQLFGRFKFLQGEISPLLKKLEEYHPWFNIQNSFSLKNTSESVVQALVGSAVWQCQSVSLEYPVSNEKGTGWIVLLTDKDSEIQLIEFNYQNGNYLDFDSKFNFYLFRN